MSTTLDVLATALLLSFVFCCVVSGVLQLFAWSRHAREGTPVSFRALRNPEPYFDPVGRRQMRTARTLLSVGGAAYLTYGALLLVRAVG